MVGPLPCVDGVFVLRTGDAPPVVDDGGLPGRCPIVLLSLVDSCVVVGIVQAVSLVFDMWLGVLQ